MMSSSSARSTEVVHVRYARRTLRGRRAGAAWNDSEITPPSSRLAPSRANKSARDRRGRAGARATCPASRAAPSPVQLGGQGERRGSYDSRVSRLIGARLRVRRSRRSAARHVLTTRTRRRQLWFSGHHNHKHYKYESSDRSLGANSP